MRGLAAPQVHRLSAWDGPPLSVLEWPGPATGDALPLLCLPGLVRTAGDFAGLAAGIGAGRRVVAIDYAGRGGSFRLQRGAAPDRYGPEACLRDVLDVAAALHVHRAVAIGTSFGGLLAMGLAAARPGLLAGVVLNDIGPEVGAAGAAFVRRFVATDPALPGLDACAAYLRATLPPLSLADPAAWRAMAVLTYAPGADGRWHPLWDTRIAPLLDRPTPDLWPLFGALAPFPLLLLHGAESDILTAATVGRMEAARRDAGRAMTVIRVPGIGHAPDPGGARGGRRARPLPGRGCGGGAGMKRLAMGIACVGGIGRVRHAPGTAGSALAVLLGAGLLALGWPVLAAAAAAASLVGVWAIRASGVAGDPGFVVIDEVAGQWVALLGLARPGVWGMLAAFALFRLLDVTKPGPVGWADRRDGAWGVMGDDLIAGAMVALLLWAVRLGWPGVLG